MIIHQPFIPAPRLWHPPRFSTCMFFNEISARKLMGDLLRALRLSLVLFSILSLSRDRSVLAHIRAGLFEFTIRTAHWVVAPRVCGQVCAAHLFLPARSTRQAIPKAHDSATSYPMTVVIPSLLSVGSWSGGASRSPAKG